MGILSMFSGTLKARKITNASVPLWQETVNFMILKGVNLKWKDSALLLSKAYCLSVYRYTCMNANVNQDKIGAVIVTTAKFFGDTLKQVWARQIPPQQISEVVNDIVESLPEDYYIWTQKVAEACRESGLMPLSSMDIAFEKAVSIYLDELVSWYDKKSNDKLNTSDKSDLHRMITRNLGSI